MRVETSWLPQLALGFERETWGYSTNASETTEGGWVYVVEDNMKAWLRKMWWSGHKSSEWRWRRGDGGEGGMDKRWRGWGKRGDSEAAELLMSFCWRRESPSWLITSQACTIGSLSLLLNWMLDCREQCILWWSVVGVYTPALESHTCSWGCRWGSYGLS